MSLSKFLHGFAICSMYFLPFAKQKQAEVSPRFQSFLKLLLWTKLNVLGLVKQLCVGASWISYWRYSHKCILVFLSFWWQARFAAIFTREIFRGWQVEHLPQIAGQSAVEASSLQDLKIYSHFTLSHILRWEGGIQTYLHKPQISQSLHYKI